MTERQKYILQCLSNRIYNQRRLAEIENELNGQTYQITPSYSGMGGRASGKPESKVENYAIRENLRKSKAEAYMAELETAEAALNCPELSKREKAILEWIAIGGRVSSFADAWGLYISYAYKIRDKALEKAEKYVTKE